MKIIYYPPLLTAVTTTRAFTNPTLPIWGNPACHGNKNWFGYGFCCHANHYGLPECFQQQHDDENFDDSAVSDTYFSYESCCINTEKTVDENFIIPLVTYPLEDYFDLDNGGVIVKDTKDAYRGCESQIWGQFLSEHKKSHGCLVCVKSETWFQTFFDNLLMPSLSIEEHTMDCRIGATLLWYVFFQHLAEGTDLYSEWRFPAKARVFQGIDDLVYRGVSEDEFFELTSISLTGMKYNCLMDHISARGAPIIPENDGNDLIIDLGMSGGMDVLFYAQHGYSVVGIEANPKMTKEVRQNLKKSEFPKLQILNAAISNNSGEVLKFYLNHVREDFSSLTLDHAAAQTENNNIIKNSFDNNVTEDINNMNNINIKFTHYVDVRTISCATLLDLYGKPFYLKIDIEGVDEDCLKQITKETAPKFLSTELPPLIEHLFMHHSDTWDVLVSQVEKLMGIIFSVGYRKFKLVPQGMWNSRVKVVDNFPGAEEGRLYAVSTQAKGGGAAGLFGDDALDIVNGRKWRGSVEDVLWDVRMFGPVYMAATQGEWFDVHCAFSEGEEWSGESNFIFHTLERVN